MVAIGLFATPYVPLMPSIVAHFFDGQSSTVGMLMSAAGIGALASGHLPLAAAGLRPADPPAVRWRRWRSGLVLIAFAWSRLLPLSLLLLAALGASALIAVNATNALLQQSVPDALARAA